MSHIKPWSAAVSLFLFAAASVSSHAQLLWTAGLNDNGWPAGTGGGPDAAFVQENGNVNVLPGSPDSITAPQGADNDYYFAGVYTTALPGVIAAYGAYDPVGVVSVDEEAAERAFAGNDLDLRYHFNLPETLKPTNFLTVTFDAFNLDTSGADPRFGVEVWVNGVRVQDQIVIRSAQLDKPYTTPAFTLDSVKAEVGPGADNIVSLRGISYNSDGGGNWMGVDYIQMDQVSSAVPTATLPWYVGMNDNAQPTNGVGGGPNTAFLQENGTVNPLPGSPKSAIAPSGADNDYYFAGLYTNVVAANGSYQPVGLVSANEEGAERAFAGTDNELRYHFNLPNNLVAADRLVVTFDPLSLDTGAANSDPRYGIEVYFNNVLVQTQLVVRATNLNKIVTTAPFTVGSVNGGVGPGTDNIVTLKGVNYSASGGGNWMGFDFISVAVAPPAATLPLAAGLNDDGQPVNLNGGGVNAAFVQENGTINPLPGSPTSTRNSGGADNDYYFAGIYNTVLLTNTYTPVGVVSANEDSAERAFAGGDNDLRYHFNLPTSLQPTDQLTVSYEALSLDDSAGDAARYGVEVYFNGVKVQDQVVIHPDDLNKTFFTPAFTAASVNAQTGPGFDNVLSVRGINYSTDGGGNWMGFDFVQLSPVAAPPFPWTVGKDDNTHLLGTLGGGPNTAFVQESGSNPPPGSPTSPQVDARADDDYYFAGIYTNVIPSNVAALGEYEPAGVVFANEQVAERAFAGSDNERRYHFNLPTTLNPTDSLVVSFDFNNLDGSGGNAQYGVEVYFNNVPVQDEIIVFQADIDADRDYSTAPFTLSSVNAQVGPGYDNIVTLRGINHNADGGGNWMGIDYVRLDPIPTPVFPWAVGKDDNDWPTGDGGGPNTSFVQENGSINDLPGRPTSRESSGGADNDYYFAGVYTNVIAGNGAYDPVGIVVANEEAAERAFAGGDNELRYHFNLPSNLNLTNLVTITYDALNLQDDQPDPRYGVEVYFNGVKVMDEVMIRTNLLGVAQTTPPFTLASVNAQLGLGTDNIVTLKGNNYNDDGGGNWMGVDYIKLDSAGGGGGTQPKFLPVTISSGQITLDWSGSGNLEWSPTLSNPQWTVIPNAPKPYSENLTTTNRFYRIKQP